MSLGDSISDGNKGTNYPFQKAVINSFKDQKTVLTAILAALGGSTADVANGPLRATGAGTIPAGFKSVSFYNAHASGNSTVNGGTLKPGEQITFAASSFPVAMSYDATGSELVITYVN